MFRDGRDKCLVLQARFLAYGQPGPRVAAGENVTFSY
jgi:hypothetical protein